MATPLHATLHRSRVHVRPTPLARDLFRYADALPHLGAIGLTAMRADRRGRLELLAKTATGRALYLDQWCLFTGAARRYLVQWPDGHVLRVTRAEAADILRGARRWIENGQLSPARDFVGGRLATARRMTTMRLVDGRA